MRTQEKLVAIEIEVSQYFRHLGLHEAQRAARSELTMSGFNEVHHGVLDDFGIHLERRDIGILAEFTEDSIRYVTYTRLDRKEGSGNTSCFHLSLQEGSYVGTDLSGGLVNRCESRDLVRTVGLNDSRYLRRIDLDMIRAAAIRGFVDRYLATLRRVERFVQIVHAAHGSG